LARIIAGTVAVLIVCQIFSKSGNAVTPSQLMSTLKGVNLPVVWFSGCLMGTFEAVDLVFPERVKFVEPLD
jgi:hypothetical protein